MPGDVLAPNVCEYPLARNLLPVVVALGSEVILLHLLDGRQESYSITRRDLAIHREE